MSLREMLQVAVGLLERRVGDQETITRHILFLFLMDMRAFKNAQKG
jgi:hypothetical protein